jgi:hypothetical protein
MELSTEKIAQIIAQFKNSFTGWKTQVDRAAINPISKKREGTEPYPEYWTGYNFSAKSYDAIVPHTRPDIYPERLFAVRSPNQDEKQAEYIKANYRPTTLPVFEEAKSTITRSFADQNWSINYKQELDFERYSKEPFELYVNYEVPLYGSIEHFMKSIVPSLKLQDAAGIIAVEPYDLEFLEETEDGEVVEGNSMVRPFPVYYQCKDIVGQELDYYYLVITPEKSLVNSGLKQERSGIVLKLYDSKYIYKISQYGKKSDMLFSAPEVYYEHDLGYVPCQKLKGTPILIKDVLNYQSPYITAVPLLDQVLLDESYLKISKATSAFPYMIALGEICTFTSREGQTCDNGQIFDLATGLYNSCPSCSGLGVKERISPSGKLLVRPKTMTSEGDSGLSGEYMKFVSPSMETLNFLRQEIDRNYSRAKDILHLPNSDATVTFEESGTATGSMNKLRALHAFLKPISDELFGLYEFILKTTGLIRYREYFGGFTLVYPTSFDVNTPTDYLEMVSLGIKAGVPPSVTYGNLYNYMKSVYYTDRDTTRIYDLILSADELLLMSAADIALRVANGTVEKWQDVLHFSAPQLVMELIRTFTPTETAPEFLDLPIEEQVVALREKAAEKVRVKLDPIQEAQQALISTMSNGLI